MIHMRKKLFTCFLWILFICSSQGQQNEVQRIDLKLDISALEEKGAQLGRANVLAVNDQLAIGQIGMVDIVLFDLKSGDIIKSIDTKYIIESQQNHISRLLGDHYFVPDQMENVYSNYTGSLAYDFRGLLFLEEYGKFASQLVTTVFNRNDVEDQMLFPSLILFDETLDQIEVIPFDPKNRSTNSAWINGGFFLGPDRLFTKMMAWQHNHNFDFLEYQLTDTHLFTLTDTLIGIKTDTIGYPGRFHGCFEFNSYHYLNLGSMLYSFEKESINNGSFIQMPNKKTPNYLQILALDDSRLVAYAINNYRESPNPTGWLLLLDMNFVSIREIHSYNLQKLTYCSLFASGNSVYVANYSEKDQKYFLLKYEISDLKNFNLKK